MEKKKEKIHIEKSGEKASGKYQKTKYKKSNLWKNILHSPHYVLCSVQKLQILIHIYIYFLYTNKTYLPRNCR